MQWATRTLIAYGCLEHPGRIHQSYVRQGPNGERWSRHRSRLIDASGMPTCSSGRADMQPALTRYYIGSTPMASIQNIDKIKL